MKKQIILLMVEDDDGHAILFQRELKKAGLTYPVVRFRNGQEVIDFFEGKRSEGRSADGSRFIMLLDIRMPKVDGIGVLEYVRHNEGLKLLPVIMLTTAANSSEVEHCHRYGCNAYVVKPVRSGSFADTTRHLCQFIETVEVPELKFAGTV